MGKKKGPDVGDSILQISTGLLANGGRVGEEGDVPNVMGFLAKFQIALGKSGWTGDLDG